jgi:hypothetical protein
VSDNYVRDERGWVFMNFWQQIPKIVRVGTDEYVFAISHNVSGCWVRPEHVERLLRDVNSRCGSCTGRQQFFVGSEMNCIEWQGKSPRFP